jgi:hypothetical protein
MPVTVDQVSLAESWSDQPEPATESTRCVGKTHHVGAFQQKVRSWTAIPSATIGVTAGPMHLERRRTAQVTCFND